MKFLEIRVLRIGLAVALCAWGLAWAIHPPADPGVSPIAFAAASPTADVDVTAAASPASVPVGSPVSYTFTILNNGLTTATAVAVTVTFSAGATVGVPAPSVGVCTQVSGTVCSLGDMPPGATETLGIVVTPTVAAGPTISGTADAAFGGIDATPANNVATAPAVVTPVADLAVTTTGSPASVVAGGQVTYTVAVANNGPSVATGVTATDTFPTGAGFVSATTPTGSCGAAVAGSVTCTLGSLAAGVRATAVIVLTAPPAGGTITNTVATQAAQIDPNPADNSATATTIVTPSADLSVTKTGPAAGQVGIPVTYTVVVTNHGPSTATALGLTDALPPGLTPLSGTITQGNAAPVTCTAAVGGFACTLASLASGASATANLAVSPTVTGPVTDTAGVIAAEPDPNPANNTSSAGTAFTALMPGRADLSLTKAGSAAAVGAGSPVTYTVVVTNNGPAGATGVAVTDTLTPGLPFTVSTSQGTCVPGASTLSCSIGALANGATATVRVVATPAAPGTVTDTATTTATETDLNPANNSASASTTVATVADLSLTKMGSPASVAAGSPVTYTVTVLNTGPAGATNVSVTDTFGTAVSFGSSTPSQGNCAQALAGAGVACSLGALASGATATVQVVVSPTTAGTITDSASVGADQADPTLVDNTATATTEVTAASADLSVTKTGPVTATAGSPITYTVTVTNNGPSRATGVLVTDTLVPGGTFTRIDQRCTSGAGAVVCAIGALAPHEVLPLTVTVGDPAAGTVTDTASVSADQADPNLANNKATATTTVAASAAGSADLAVTMTAAPASPTVGSPVTYTLTASNAGPSGATNVVLAATLPSSFTTGASTTFLATGCTPGAVVSCSLNLGTLAPGAGVTKTVVATPTAAGTFRATASISADQADPTTADNTATVVTVVAAVAAARGGPASPSNVTGQAATAATAAAVTGKRLPVTGGSPQRYYGIALLLAGAALAAGRRGLHLLGVVDGPDTEPLGPGTTPPRQEP